MLEGSRGATMFLTTLTANCSGSNGRRCYHNFGMHFTFYRLSSFRCYIRGFRFKSVL